MNAESDRVGRLAWELTAKQGNARGKRLHPRARVFAH
jgi:hypothetical protein